jgi:ankyrin repeat protein
MLVHRTMYVGHTPLHWAARMGYGQTVRVLVEEMGWILLSDKDEEGDTPLHIAATEGWAHGNSKCDHGVT